MIVLFTDFGDAGPYTGQMQARLLQLAPDVPVVRLFSDLSPFDVQAAACLLPAYCSGFPPGTVFLCVVDPGVGSERPGVLVHADDRWFVGPNEGLFALLARRADRVDCALLPLPADASSSFHGRDVFAPVAARLAMGDRVTAQAQPAQLLDRTDWPDDLFQVVYTDHYGNAVTGVRANEIETSATLNINGHLLNAAKTFSAVPHGAAFWYANSNGLIELAVNRGRADEQLGAVVGTAFRSE